jgi:RNA polymerase sigma factor (TIGR02999 family)
MRQILCNYARDRRTEKRGGGAAHIPLDLLGEFGTGRSISQEPRSELADLDDALQRLEKIDRRLSDVVECRFFGGLSIEDTATALGISPATVKRDWSLARAWLFRELAS